VEYLTDLIEDAQLVPKTSLVVCFVLNVALLLADLNKIPKFSTGMFLLGFSLLNAVAFFTKTKLYRLYSKFDEDNLQSPNMFSTLLAVDDKEEDFVPIRELYVWDPHYFTTRIFTYFSPLQVGIVVFSEAYRIPIVGPLAHLLLATFIALGLRIMIGSYEGLVRDRQIISNEVIAEDNRFTQKKLSVLKMDKSCQVPPLTALGTESPRGSAPTSPFTPVSDHVIKRKGKRFPTWFTLN